MTDPDWYETAGGDALSQGDILLSYPIVTVGELTFPISETSVPAVDVNFCDVIVLTQSCDLAHAKVHDVLLAQVFKWPEYLRANPANSILRSEEFRKALVAGNLPNLFLLHKRDDAPELPWSVVDFHRLSTSRKESIQRFVPSLSARLRLRSPYREHLAQAFARYFMRVGLPVDAKAFIKEGKIS